MLTLDTIPPAIWYYAMTRSGGDGIHGGIGSDADKNLIGKGLTQQNMSFQFDRTQNWDEERERLSDRQRIRDIEVLLQGDPTRFYVGVLQQQRSHVRWLTILTLLQAVTIILLIVLVYVIWSTSTSEAEQLTTIIPLLRMYGAMP